eukprot:scaffold18862_cov55-Attheya_sp.AAC.7
MVYVGADGNVAERRSPWRFSIVTDFFTGILNFITLFFSAVTNPPDRRLTQGRGRTTYAERQGVRKPSSGGAKLGGGKGSNIRGVKNLGEACGAAGG